MSIEEATDLIPVIEDMVNKLETVNKDIACLTDECYIDAADHLSEAADLLSEAVDAIKLAESLVE